MERSRRFGPGLEIWVKAASDHQTLLIVTASLMFFMMGLVIGPRTS